MSLRASQRQLHARLAEGTPSVAGEKAQGSKPGGKAARAKKCKPPVHPLSTVEKAQRAKAKTDKTAQNLRILLSQ
jgi:hypothetical protein